MNSLYARISASVPKITERLLEEYRVAQLARAPEYARFVFEGSGWEFTRKDKYAEFEAVAWRMAFCEIIQVLMESDEDLNDRIDALEGNNK